ncbi:MAG: polysaccharide deacetylase family protein [Acidobacteriota bacterium]
MESGLPAHYKPRQHAPIWETPSPDWREKLWAAVEKNSGSYPSTVFFRADDIGAGGRAFDELCRLFRHHDVPLGMAVVPAWLSEVRKKQLFESAPLDEPLWGWHQHGWRHVNWQRAGKKSEFGEQRPFEKQWRDIRQGLLKMQDIFGDHFLRVFTPPWNRLSVATIRILQDLEFEAASTAGPFPRGNKTAIKNIRVQIDLHTRKEKDGAADFNELLDEIAGIGSKREPVGLMIHHHRMTAFAFEFLDELLSAIKAHPRIQTIGLKGMLEKEYEEQAGSGLR